MTSVHFDLQILPHPSDGTDPTQQILPHPSDGTDPTQQSRLKQKIAIGKYKLRKVMPTISATTSKLTH